jgi:hypothetical protein
VRSRLRWRDLRNQDFAFRGTSAHEACLVEVLQAHARKIKTLLVARPSFRGRIALDLLDAGARKSLVCSVGVDDESVVGDGLELAFERFFAVEHHADLLSGAEFVRDCSRRDPRRHRARN